MILDIIFYVLLGLAMWRGFRRGFVVSVLSLFAFLLGLIIALKFSYLASLYIENIFEVSNKYLPLISFVIIFILVIIVVNLLAKFIQKFIEFVQLSLLNKIAGALLSGFILTIIFSTLIFFINQIEIITPEMKADSKVYFYIEPLAPVIINSITSILPFLKDLFISLEEYFESLST